MKAVVVVILLLSLFLVSCQAGTSLTGSVSVFYPDITTKDGGSWSDPGGRGHGMEFGSKSSGTKGIGNYGKE